MWGGLRAVEDGKSAHVQIIQSGCESDVFMGSSLINMYAKCGSMEEALKDARTWCHLLECHAWRRICHMFVVDDGLQRQMGEIYAELKRLSRADACYGVCARYEIYAAWWPEEKEMVFQLCHHSEKLALALGFISTPPSTLDSLCITKQWWVCVDCHSSTKFISELFGRAMINSQVCPSHLNHFEDGKFVLARIIDDASSLIFERWDLLSSCL